MENENVKMTDCSRCGSNSCLKTRVSPSVNTYQCLGCGFYTNSLMKRDSEFLNEQKELLPELYKALAGEDENGLVWLPTTINIPEVGMIFMNGGSVEEAKWAAVRALPVTEENKEEHKLKDGTYPKYFMDLKNKQEFEEHDFIEAMDYLGLFSNSNVENT